MDSAIKISDVLPIELFWEIQDDLEYWKNSNYSMEGTCSFLGRSGADELVFNKAQGIIKLKMQKYIEHHLMPVRIHLNAAFPNQKASVFHTDFDETNMLTFILYTTPVWNTQWGGETVVKLPEGGYQYIEYVPNNGSFFPSHWEHYGASPNAHCESMRTSVAFTYEICYNSPIVKNTV